MTATGTTPVDRGAAPLPPEEHLGSGEEPMTLRQGLARGGLQAFALVALLGAVGEAGRAAVDALAPEIAATLHLDDAVLVLCCAAPGAVALLGALPLGFLADRARRAPILGALGLFGAAASVATATAAGAPGLFAARAASGVSGVSAMAVQAPILADAYPVGVRGRVTGAVAAVASMAAALAVGLAGVAVLEGPEGAWRGVLYALGAMGALAAAVAFALREPGRGRWDRAAVAAVPSEADGDAAPADRSFETACTRVRHLPTVRPLAPALAAIGCLLVPREVLSVLFAARELGLGPAGRGAVVAVWCAVAAVALLVAGPWFDRAFRRDPARIPTAIGWVVLTAGLTVPLQFAMPGAVLFTLVGLPAGAGAAVAFAMVVAMLQQTVPSPARGLGMAYASLYLFGVGALGGSVLAAALMGPFGLRRAAAAVVLPAALLGAAVLARSSRAVRAGVATVVAEVRRDRAEAELRASAPEDVPALAVADLDVAYGAVQVVFGVGFHVSRGETLALLGTNGGGKTTVLKAVAGLLEPSRGTVRLDGRDITFCSAERRAAMGIQLLPGGHGVFPSMTVAENLEVGSYLLRRRRRLQRARVDAVLDLFPVLADRRAQVAGSLSGGQQQQLALARVMLHEPEVLIIDELSLGLAPGVVAELLETVEQLKEERDQTIVVVEQSLDIAMAIAERAVFMEKGEVRFEGPTRELADRHDLVRAVFFGADHGDDHDGGRLGGPGVGER